MDKHTLMHLDQVIEAFKEETDPKERALYLRAALRGISTIYEQAADRLDALIKAVR